MLSSLEHRCGQTTRLLGLAQQCIEEIRSESDNKLVSILREVKDEHRDTQKTFEAMATRIAVAEQTLSSLAQVQPQSLALEFWWSGKALLQAARNALVYPEPLQRAAAALSPHQPLSPQQAVARYLHQLLEKDFPRLLLLVFELGGLYGSWVWDGDDVAFAWNAQMHAATPPVPPSAHLQPLSHIHHHNHHHLAHRPTQL
jgi:predicted esterase YcpF (UPF0227 family)